VFWEGGNEQAGNARSYETSVCEEFCY